MAQNTGLSKALLYGWVNAETSGWNTTNGPNNWLNVGSFDSGFQGGGANVWNDPISAADATSAFILGRPVHGKTSPVGPGSSSIQAIAQTAGQSLASQIAAVQDSNWASSHYGYNLASDVQPFVRGKINVKNFGGPNGGRVRPGGSGTSSPTDMGSGVLPDLTNYMGSVGRTMPASEDVSFGSDLLAPFSWAGNQISSGFSSFFGLVSGPASAVYDVGKGVDEFAGESIKIMELLPWYFLRYAEFMIGNALLLVGLILSMMPARQGTSRGLVKDVVAATPIGRANRIRKATTLGRREGQAEHYRLAARREARATEASKVSKRQAQSLSNAGQARNASS